jgi:hypothetical protein
MSNFQGAVHCPPLRDREHDSTVALVFEIDLSMQADPLIRAPAYKLVSGKIWQGTAHVKLYGELKALIEHWHTR